MAGSTKMEDFFKDIPNKLWRFSKFLVVNVAIITAVCFVSYCIQKRLSGCPLSHLLNCDLPFDPDRFFSQGLVAQYRDFLISVSTDTLKGIKGDVIVGTSTLLSASIVYRETIVIFVRQQLNGALYEHINSCDLVVSLEPLIGPLREALAAALNPEMSPGARAQAILDAAAYFKDKTGLSVDDPNDDFKRLKALLSPKSCGNCDPVAQGFYKQELVLLLNLLHGVRDCIVKAAEEGLVKCAQAVDLINSDNPRKPSLQRAKIGDAPAAEGEGGLLFVGLAILFIIILGLAVMA